MNDTIVDTIRMILQQRNLAQKELAQKISMPESTLSKTLRKTRAITIGEVDTIAKELGIPVHQLYEASPLGCQQALSLLDKVQTREAADTIQKLSILSQRILFYKNLRSNTEQLVRSGEQHEIERARPLWYGPSLLQNSMRGL